MRRHPLKQTRACFSMVKLDWFVGVALVCALYSIAGTLFSSTSLEGNMGQREMLVDRHHVATFGKKGHQRHLEGQTVVICTVQKDEHMYNDEWTSYHLGLGFDKIFIYDNSVDSSLEKKWPEGAKNDRVEIIPYPGEKVQMKAFKDCGKRVKDSNHTWVTFIDVDEFYVLKKHDNIHDFAAEYAPRGAVAINWQVFGTSNRTKYEDFPVTLRFQCRFSWRRNKYVKSLTRVKDLGDINEIRSPHHQPLKNDLRVKDTDGVDIEGSTHWGPRDVAIINHYYYKSFDEHLQKRNRGDVFYGKTHGRDKYTALAKQGLDPYGNSLPPGAFKDSTAWDTLKRVAPQYKDMKPSLLSEPEGCKQPSPWEIETYTEENMSKDDRWAEKLAFKIKEAEQKEAAKETKADFAEEGRHKKREAQETLEKSSLWQKSVDVVRRNTNWLKVKGN